MGRSAANRQGIVIELSGKFTLSGGHPSKRISVYRCSAPVKRVWCQRFWFFFVDKIVVFEFVFTFSWVQVSLAPTWLCVATYNSADCRTLI